MGKVDKARLADALNQLSVLNFIDDWEARPLGTYLLRLNSGEVLRPDAKETAMFVQGFTYGADVGAAKARKDIAFEQASGDHDAARRALGLSLGLRQLLEWLLEDEASANAAGWSYGNRETRPDFLIKEWAYDSDGDIIRTYESGRSVTNYAEDVLNELIRNLHSEG